MLVSVTQWPGETRTTPIDVSVSETFESFYKREFQQLRALAQVITGNAAAAEDLVQDAFTEAHKHWEKISRYEKPGAWVRRVMLNKSTSRFRRLKTETKGLAALGRRRLEVVQPVEPLDEIWDEVRRLPTRQAQTIALFYWDDLSIAEVAGILDCSSETIKTHLKRARSTLGNKLSHFAGVDLA